MRELDSVLELVKSICPGPCVIAGGAVRDTLLGRKAKDIDVFYLGAFENADRMWGDLSQYRPAPIAFKRNKMLVAEVDTPIGVAQLFASPHGSVDEVLDNTDWNVSAFAYDGRLHSRQGIDDIQEGRPLRLIRVTKPIATMRRGFEFSDRFGMVFEFPDVVMLSRLIAGMGDHRRVRPVNRRATT